MDSSIRAKVLVGLFIIPLLFIIWILGMAFRWSYMTLLPPLLLIILIRMALWGR